MNIIIGLERDLYDGWNSNSIFTVNCKYVTDVFNKHGAKLKFINSLARTKNNLKVFDDCNVIIVCCR